MELLTQFKVPLVGLLLCLWTTSVADASPDLIVATRNNISRISLGDMKVFPLVGGTEGSVALDYDMTKNDIFWSETTQPKILSLSLKSPDRSQQVLVRTGERSTPDGIALDWVHGNLYWTDATLDTIEVINLDTRLRKVLINENLDEARAIVLDPRDNHGPYMYWTDWGTEASVERAGLDGSNRKKIVTQNVEWPNGLAIDFAENRIYWIDSKLHYIGRARLDGRSPEIIFRTSIQHQIFAMDLFQESIYYSEWNNKAVYKYNKQTNETVLVRRDTVTPNGIKVVDVVRQPRATDRCAGWDCGASALCVPSPSLSFQLGHTCVCADNPPDSTDTCVPGPGVQRSTTPTAQTTQSRQNPTQNPTSNVNPNSGASGSLSLEWNIFCGLLFTILAKVDFWS